MFVEVNPGENGAGGVIFKLQTVQGEQIITVKEFQVDKHIIETKVQIIELTINTLAGELHKPEQNKGLRGNKL